jgi:hypothetical protein
VVFQPISIRVLKRTYTVLFSVFVFRAHGAEQNTPNPTQSKTQEPEEPDRENPEPKECTHMKAFFTQQRERERERETETGQRTIAPNTAMC